MSCEFCKNEKTLPSERKGIYAAMQAGKLLVCEDAQHESCPPGCRWVTVEAMFTISFCPCCGERIGE